MVFQEPHLWLNLAEMNDVDKSRFLDAPISQAGLFNDTVEGFAQQFMAIQQQTEVIQHILCVIHWPPLPLGTDLSLGALLRPPELFRSESTLNRQLGWRVEPLAAERHPPSPSQASSCLGSRQSGPDTGNPDMLEFAFSQKMARTSPLLPPEEGREENFYLCSVDGPRASGTHFFKERAIFFSSRFSDPRDDSVRCVASSLSHTTHLASSQESTVRGRSTSPLTSSQSRLGPREFCKEVSKRAAFCTIQPYSPSLHHHRYVNCAVGATCTALEAWLSPFHWLTRTI